MSATAVCKQCGNELGEAGGSLCVGCQNERAGLCRWCGLRAPQSASELCGECEASAKRVVATGSFAGDLERPALKSSNRATAPSGAPGLHVAITRSQLRDLRDGHLVTLRSAGGERAQLTFGTLSEVQIEALAAGRPVQLHLVIDTERTRVTIAPAAGPTPAGATGGH